MTHDQLMREAIRLSIENIANGGGPFGAVIARDGEIIATGVNRVTASNDPTAHAEVSAIRRAAEALGTFNLSGCEIYTSCEPCPMCLAACYWAHISRVYYAAGRDDAAAAGFGGSGADSYVACLDGGLEIAVPPGRVVDKVAELEGGGLLPRLPVMAHLHTAG